MCETYVFGMHWMHRKALFYDEVSAASTEEAREYFNSHKRDDVALLRVELLGPVPPLVLKGAFSLAPSASLASA